MPVIDTSAHGREPFLYPRPQQPDGQPTASSVVPLLVLACVLVPALLAYALLTANEVQVAAICIAVLGLLVVLARPFWGLLFFVVLLYVRPEEAIQGLAGTHLTLAVGIATMVSVALQMLLHKQRIARTPLNWAILGFFVAAVISAAPGGTISSAAMDISRLVLIVLLVLNLVRTPQRYRALLVALVLLTAYLAGYTVYLYTAGHALDRNGEIQAVATGVFSDPNDLSATLVAGLALTLGLATTVKVRGRILLGLLAVLIVAAIYLTASRGGMLALLAVVSLFCLYFAKRKAIAVMLAVVAVSVLYGIGSHGRMTDYDANDDSATSRFRFWYTAVMVLETHPVLGVGYDQFYAENDGMAAHNSFAHCFAEIGLIGYFFWMGCLYFAYKKRPALQSARDGDRRLALDTAGARLALTGYLVAAFWISRTYTPVLYILFTLPVARQLTCTVDNPDEASAMGRWTARDTVRIGCIALASIVFIYLLAVRMK